MPPTVTLSPAEQLVVRDATAAEAIDLWRALVALYHARRGPSREDPALPAATVADAVDLVNAYERLAAPIAPALAYAAPALWAAWRGAYAHVFAVATAAPNLHAPMPGAVALWRGLLEAFAHHLAAFVSHAPIPFHH